GPPSQARARADPGRRKRLRPAARSRRHQRSTRQRRTEMPATHAPSQRRPDDRWADLDRLLAGPPTPDAVTDEITGRRIRIGDRWLTDFASCNYLGFDLEPEIIDSVEGALRRWGTHPSWSRLLGNPRLYLDIEDQLTELLGAPDTLVLPTITHIH